MEEVRHLVETKVGHGELQSEISNITMKIDDIQKDFMKKSSALATIKDVTNLTQIVETKANINDVNEALGTKASKESVINALHRKANKAEVDSVLKSKVDIEEIQNLINIVNNKSDIQDLEKLQHVIENKAERNDIVSLSNALANKSEMKDFDLLNVCYQELKRDTNKRIDDLDQDIDRLIENIKKEFQNITISVNNLDVKKADFKEFEKINNQVIKKIDSENLNSALSQLKSDLYDSFGHYKNDILQNRKIFEENILDKLSIVEKNNERAIDEIPKLKERLNEVRGKIVDKEDIMKQTQGVVNNTSKELLSETHFLKAEIQKIHKEIEELFLRKTEKKEIEAIKNQIFNDLDKKAEIADLDELYKGLQKEINEKSEDSRVTINSTLKNFENDIIKAIDKKANLYDVTTMINNKADSTSTNLAIQNKVSISEFENLRNVIDKINREIINKMDYNKFEAYMADTRGSIDDIQKDLMMKANIKEILNLMKNKADIDDVNKALTQIHDELDGKCNLDQVIKN